MTQIPPPPRSPAPLYTLGTATRIERIKLMYLRPVGSSLIPCGKDILNRQWAQAIEADQWRLLSEFIDGGVAEANRLHAIPGR